MGDIVFVFGSNLAGRHGRGAALEAARKWGARYGLGEGPSGNSYAIPTKDAQLVTLELRHINEAVNRFIAYARRTPEASFMVTAIGCGLAGYTPQEIAPMFRGIPRNVFISGELAQGFRQPSLEGDAR